MRKALPTRPSPDIAGALAWLREASQPATRERLEHALAELSVLTARPPTDDDTADLQLHAYTERLRQYPADVALSALRHSANECRFWPSWSELRELCERDARWRREAIEALEAELKPTPSTPIQ